MKNREPQAPDPTIKRAGGLRRAGPLSPAKRADMMRTAESLVAQAEDAAWMQTHHFRTCDLCTAVMTLRAREARLAYEADSTPRCHDCCFTAPNHAPDCAERQKAKKPGDERPVPRLAAVGIPRRALLTAPEDRPS